MRQLNNYGFRKCHSDRFEFGVEGFELGKPELLTTLKRHDAPRSKKGSGSGTANGAGPSGAAKVSGGKTTSKDPHVPKTTANFSGNLLPNGSTGGLHNAGHASYQTRREGSPSRGAQSLELGAYGGVTSEVEQLKRDRLLLLKEVMRLREEQNTTADEVRRLSSRLTSTEQFQTTMMGFVEQVRESGGNLSNLSFDGFGAMGMDLSEVVQNGRGNAPTGGAPRKRRQMYLPSVPVTNAVVASGGGDTEMRLASGYGAPTNSSYVSPGAAGSNPGGYGSNSHHHHQTPHSTSLADRFQEIEDDETLDDGGDGDDDALAHQMFGPLSPNPRAAIQLPEHEEWLEEFAANEMKDEARGDRDDGDDGDDQKPDNFVNSILQRGPSLEKQLSLGFLDSMNSAEIGEMVREMNIGKGAERVDGDEVAARFQALNPGRSGA